MNMEKLFGFDIPVLEKINGYITAKEIAQQPRLWKETLEIVKNNRERITRFYHKVLQKNDVRIIFTGAGSSSFVGDCVVPYLRRKLFHRVESIPTTDILTHPKNYLPANQPVLLISCARSGNSPESVAAVELAEKLVGELYQIFLTCNPQGDLAQKATEDEKNLLLLMPEDANDQGFAMTGSFTSMVLAILLIFELSSFEELKQDILSMANLGETVLQEQSALLKKLAADDFDRVVYLGSSALKGLAKESALKTLELTRGRVVATSDSFLGFRHGPKSIIDDRTIIFSYLSNDKYARQYEVDLLKEMAAESGNKKVLAISSRYDTVVQRLVDHYVYIGNEEKVYKDDIYLLFNYVLIAQMFALFKSIQLGVSPDNPSPDGIVNRVVKGVTIYPYRA